MQHLPLIEALGGTHKWHCMEGQLIGNLMGKSIKMGGGGGGVPAALERSLKEEISLGVYGSLTLLPLPQKSNFYCWSPCIPSATDPANKCFCL